MAKRENKVYRFGGAVAATTTLMVEGHPTRDTENGMGLDFTQGYVSVTCYDADPFDANSGASIVSAGAGTLAITVSEDGSNYGTITNGTVDVTSATYDRPNWAGHAQDVKATPSGITTATHYVVTVVRS